MPFDVFYAGRLNDIMTGGPADERNRDLRWGLDFYRERGHALPTQDNLAETHVYICTSYMEDMEEIFEAFQGEFCDATLHDLVRDAGAGHLSMSVGDILRDVTTGDLWIVEPCSFAQVK